MHLDTILSHLSLFEKHKDPHGASHFPIYNTATYDYKKQEGDHKFDYTRLTSPTTKNLEAVFAKVENG